MKKSHQTSTENYDQPSRFEGDSKILSKRVYYLLYWLL